MIGHGGLLRVFSFRSPDKGFWACLGDITPDMPRGYNPRHAQTAGDLGLAVQFNAETLWHFTQLRYPRVE